MCKAGIVVVNFLTFYDILHKTCHRQTFVFIFIHKTEETYKCMLIQNISVFSILVEHVVCMFHVMCIIYHSGDSLFNLGHKFTFNYVYINCSCQILEIIFRNKYI